MRAAAVPSARHVACAVSHTKDVIDASVVLCARAHGTAIVTSDPQDLARLDPAASPIVV